MVYRRNITTTFILIGVTLTVLRMGVVMLWAIVGQRSLSSSVWVELGLMTLSVLVLASIGGAVVSYFNKRLAHEFRYDNLITATTTFAISTLALLLFAAILPGNVEAGTPEDIVSVITSHLVALGTYTLSIGLAAFLTVVALQRQHRGTRLMLSIQTFSVLGTWLATVLFDVGSAFQVVAITFVVIGGIATLLNLRRLNWLATITLDKKVRLLWLCICGAFAAAVLTIMLVFNAESYLRVSTQMFLRSGSALPAVLSFYGLLFFIRLMFATLAALPNSGIVDRRSNEVLALAGLTRLVAQSAGVEALLTSVTQYSLSVCRAHGAWCEIYVQGGVHVTGTQLVTPEYVRQLHIDPRADNIFRRSDAPLFMRTLAEISLSTPLANVIRSLIVIPILSAGSRVGSLVMFSTVEYGFEQEDVDLLSAFGDSISVGLEQARLLETSLEKERLQHEFEVARSIQASLLPRASPINKGWDIDAVMIPATQVGGDYYDFFAFENGHSGAIIADVSGKGVPAALYMATLKGVVLAQSRDSSGPADLLRRINATLHGAMDRRTYISIAVAEFNPDLGAICIARAGHTPILVRTQQGVHTICPAGAAIGLLPPDQFDVLISEESIVVESGDLCLLTTDGVTERRNGAMSELTNAPLVELLASSNAASATELVQQTLAVVQHHAGNTEPHDDITIVAMKVHTMSATHTAPTHKDRLAGVSA